MLLRRSRREDPACKAGVSNQSCDNYNDNGERHGTTAGKVPRINQINVTSFSRLWSPSRSGLCWNMLVILIITVLLQSLLVSGLPVAARSGPNKHGNHKHNLRYHHNHRHQHHHHRHKPQTTTPKPSPAESLEAIDASSSLSIVTPLEVLRRNMIHEIQRTRHRQAEDKVVQSNRKYLEKIG